MRQSRRPAHQMCLPIVGSPPQYLHVIQAHSNNYLLYKPTAIPTCYTPSINSILKFNSIQLNSFFSVYTTQSLEAATITMLQFFFMCGSKNAFHLSSNNKNALSGRNALRICSADATLLIYVSAIGALTADWLVVSIHAAHVCIWPHTQHDQLMARPV